MDNVYIAAAALVTEADALSARVGPRFARLDRASQLAVLAVEKLGVTFDCLPSHRIAICLSARAGSLTTDVDYWGGRDTAGGPSPTLFAYTLPSAAIGEIAIRYRLTGPNLCFVGDDTVLVSEAADLIRRGEADACVCISSEIVSAAAADWIGLAPSARACAAFLTAAGPGLCPLGENSRDMASICALASARNSAS